MAFEPLRIEFTGFCPVCMEMAVLCWHDTDLRASICEDCAERLAKVECTLLALRLDHPSPELIKRNP